MLLKRDTTRTFPKAAMVFSALVLLATVLVPATAEARCRNVTQTHNGTNFFYADGAAGTAAYKVRLAVEDWQKKTGVKKVRIGKIKTSCGKWFIKYGLPHQHCVAKARFCY